MKKMPVILSVLFSASVVSGAISEKGAAKLVRAVWKTPADSIDITYYVTAKDNTRTEQTLRRGYEQVHEQMHGPQAELNPYMVESRERFIQRNVERILKEQRDGGQELKFRIRFDGNRQRIDKTYGSPERTVFKGTAREEFLPKKQLDANTPFEITAIETPGPTGNFERYDYFHKGKTATKKSILGRSRVENSKIMGFMMMPCARVLQRQLGTGRNGSYEPNETMIEQLCAGTRDDISIDIRPDEDAPEVKQRIEINLYDNDENVVLKLRMVCDKEDYSRVYHYEAFGFGADHPMLTRTCRKFDSQGVPHEVILIEYNGDGEVELYKTYRIEKARLNIPIPEEVFQFNPPKDYVVRDFDQTPEEQREADIARLKKQFEHEVWTFRLRALVALRKRLRAHPAELRDIAVGAKDDERREIRELAAVILKESESKPDDESP